MPPTDANVVTIYIRPKKIIRGGRRIDGFQGWFTTYGGITATTAKEVEEHCRKIAALYGQTVEKVVLDAD